MIRAKRSFRVLHLSMVVLALAASSVLGAPRADSSWHLLLGGSFMHSIRRGYYELPGRTHAVSTPELQSWGFIVGLRKEVAPSLSIQTPVMVDFGSRDVDTLFDVRLSDGSEHELAIAYNYTSVTLSPELHYVVHDHGGLTPFLRLGLGLNHMQLKEEGRINDETGSARRRVEMQSGLVDKTLSLALQGGVGLKLPIPSDAWDLSLSYVYRYWHPVKLDYDKDMPLRAIPYWETFRSHLFQVIAGFRFSL